MNDRVASLSELRKTLAQDIERLGGETRTLNKGSLDIESYKQDITQTEETARRIAAELESLTVEQKAVARVTELESAFVSQADDFKKRAIATAGATFFALILAGFVAYAVDQLFRRNRIVEARSSISD